MSLFPDTGSWLVAVACHGKGGVPAKCNVKVIMYGVFWVLLVELYPHKVDEIISN